MSRYNDEISFFSAAKNFDDGKLTREDNEKLMSKPDKVYRSGYIQGHPHLIVKSWFNVAIEVYYEITGERHIWLWNNRKAGWNWFHDRKLHIQGLR